MSVPVSDQCQSLCLSPSICVCVDVHVHVFVRLYVHVGGHARAHGPVGCLFRGPTSRSPSSESMCRLQSMSIATSVTVHGQIDVSVSVFVCSCWSLSVPVSTTESAMRWAMARRSPLQGHTRRQHVPERGAPRHLQTAGRDRHCAPALAQGVQQGAVHGGVPGGFLMGAGGVCGPVGGEMALVVCLRFAVWVWVLSGLMATHVGAPAAWRGRGGRVPGRASAGPRALEVSSDSEQTGCQ